VALLIGLGLVAINNVTESRELDRMLSRVHESLDTIAYADRRVAATVDYTRPLLFGANVPAHVRAGLQQLVADAAAGQVGAVEQERAKAAHLSVLAWHRDLRTAKRALVVYLDARVAYLRGVAANTHTLYVAHPELDQLLRDTRAAFADAVGPGGRQRVEAAFSGGIRPA
jgi:hypothetical protein